LQPAACNKVRGPRVLDHVQGIFVPHVDDRRADLDAFGPGADGRQQREGRAELTREVMYAEIGPIRAQLLGRDRQVDRLQKCVGSRTCL
jgi:hypothetical protein